MDYGVIVKYYHDLPMWYGDIIIEYNDMTIRYGDLKHCDRLIEQIMMILAVESWLWNPSCEVLVAESWLPNPGCGILAVQSMTHGYGILAAESFLWTPFGRRRPSSE